MLFSYSLGDAIDWKRFYKALWESINMISYSLGDAIDWKPKPGQGVAAGGWCVSYSLGDAIDWKLNCVYKLEFRGCVSYSLGDAIDWKL